MNLLVLLAQCFDATFMIKQNWMSTVQNDASWFFSRASHRVMPKSQRSLISTNYECIANSNQCLHRLKSFLKGLSLKGYSASPHHCIHLAPLHNSALPNLPLSIILCAYINTLKSSHSLFFLEIESAKF